jgi:hypothetical protein
VPKLGVETVSNFVERPAGRTHELIERLQRSADEPKRMSLRVPLAAQSAALWAPSPLGGSGRRAQFVSLPLVLVISSFVLCADKQQAALVELRRRASPVSEQNQNQTATATTAIRRTQPKQVSNCTAPASPIESHGNEQPESGLELQFAPSFDQIYFDQPGQKVLGPGGWPQMMQANEQERQLADLLDRQQRLQAQLLRHYQRGQRAPPNQHYHPFTAPVGSFYSLAGATYDTDRLPEPDQDRPDVPLLPPVIMSGGESSGNGQQPKSSYHKPTAQHALATVTSQPTLPAVGVNHHPSSSMPAKLSAFSRPYSSSDDDEQRPHKTAPDQGARQHGTAPIRQVGASELANIPQHDTAIETIIGRPPLTMVAAKPVAKPKVAVNLSSLLAPGEVLLSSQEVKKLTDHGPSSVQTKTSVVDVKEIENILEKLKPLALGEHDKATGLETASSLPNDLPNAISAFDQDERNESNEEHEEEDEEDGGKHVERILPTSHLFGGSQVGLVAANRQEASKARVGTQSGAAGRPNPTPETQADGEADDQETFVNALKTLGAQLANEPEADLDDDQRLGSASTQEDAFYRPGGEIRLSTGSKRGGRNANKLGIPIALLVDHLMAGSRLATRRGDTAYERAHAIDDKTSGPIPEGGQQEQDDMDDEEDDEDDAEADPGGEDGESVADSIASLATSESSRDGAGLRVMPPSASSNWVPLGGPGGVRDRRGHAPGSNGHARKAAPVMSRQQSNSNQLGPSSGLQSVGGEPTARAVTRAERKRRRGRRRRSDKKRNMRADPNGIVVGKKKLSRLELIRLIKVLNRMANDKRPSKERDTSRKLLRHLIRVALDNYKHSQEANAARPPVGVAGSRDQQPVAESVAPSAGSAGLTDKRLRESLRSLLLEPTLGSSSPAGGGGGASKVSVVMQPWRVKSALIKAERQEGDEDPVDEPPSSLDERADGDLRRPKSLADISDDLERYFDTDFFEDLADKTNASVTSEQPQQTAAPSEAPAKRGRSKSRSASTNVPVPIVVDQKHAEDADEDDVDLDHVRVRPISEANGDARGHRHEGDDGSVTTGQRPRRARKRRGERKGARVPGAVKGRVAESRDNKRREAQPKGESSDDEESEGDKEGGEREPDEGQRRRQTDESRTRRRRLDGRRSGGANRGARNDEDDEDSGGQNDTRQEGKHGDEKGHEKQDADNDEEDDEEESNSADGARERPVEARKAKHSGEAKRAAPSRDTRRHRRRSRPKTKQSRQQLAGRDEIPAPIVSSRVAGAKRAHSAVANSTGPVASAASKSVPAKSKLATVAKSADGDTAKRWQPTKAAAKDSRRAQGVKSNKAKGGKPAKAATPAKKATTKVPLVEVVNYFNEGSEICEDGKCKLAMKSSHPKVAERLKGRPDKRDLGEQVAEWLRKDGVAR